MNKSTERDMTTPRFGTPGSPGSGSQAGGSRQRGTSETCEAETAATAAMAATATRKVRHAFSITIMAPGCDPHKGWSSTSVARARDPPGTAPPGCQMPIRADRLIGVTTSDAAPRTQARGVWAPGVRLLTAGLVMNVTLVAFESLSVATVLPVVSHQLGDLRLYGWVFSAFFL